MTMRVGIVGTGFIAKGVIELLIAARKREAAATRLFAGDKPLHLSRTLTRRPDAHIEGVPTETLTRSLDDLIDNSDIILEVSGDPVHATVVVEQALKAGKRVVTMNSEFHITTGAYFHGKGYLTEAEGDQPGSLALLKRDAEAMGFQPQAYVNIKGFLDPNPTLENMQYWSKLQQLSLHETTSFTDGTKLQIEQAVCANAFDAALIEEGMLGRSVPDLNATDYLIEAALELGKPVSDYVMCKGAPPGVYMLATHEVSRSRPQYGPYEKLLTQNKKGFVLLRPYHLCALEVPKSLAAAARGEAPLMAPGPVPYASVAAVSKNELAAGGTIETPIGGFDVRGKAIRAAEHLDHVPLGLLKGARLRRTVPPEQIITQDDVELLPTRAAEIWAELRDAVKTEAESALQPPPLAKVGS